MKTTIEAVKKFIPQIHWKAVDEICELYHLNKCEEAGRELPTKEEIEGLSFAYRTTIQQGKGFIKGYETCMERASKSLASLQSQLEAKEQELKESVDCTEHMKEVCDNYQKDLEAKDKEIEYLKHCEKARQEETEGWERLKVIAEESYPIEKIVGRDVSLVIEKLFKELKLQLQEAKAEVERLEKELKYCDVEPEEDDFERYSLPICFEPREELKELNLRKDRIDREWEKWNERINKIKSQLIQK